MEISSGNRYILVSPWADSERFSRKKVEMPKFRCESAG